MGTAAVDFPDLRCRRGPARPPLRFALRAGWVCAAVLGLAAAVEAQPVALDDTASAPNSTPTEKIGFSNGSLIVAPVPFQNPVLGAGLALGGAWLFRDAEGAKTSTLGFGYFRTENGSEGYGLGFDLNFGLTGWQTSLLFGDLDLTYDLFVREVAVPLRQTGRGVRLDGVRDLSEAVSVGVGLSYAESTILGVDGSPLSGKLLPDATFQLSKLNLTGTYDTRDDTDYPTEGLLASAAVSLGYLDGARRDQRYAKAVLSGAGYRPVLGNDVMAWVATGCAADDSAPFFDACSLGGTDSLRGYGATQFIDQALASVQLEYRGRITGILGDRLGYVVFGGVGATGNDLGGILDEDLKSAYGVGARIRLSRAFPVDYAIDLSRNDAGETLVYVTVGQRF